MTIRARFFCIALVLGFLMPLTATGAEPFVVHEWGVLVTGAGQETLATSPPALLDGLPPFVLKHDLAYQPKRKNFGWDKPVIHLYGPEGLKVKISVGTPKGKPLAYWPQPTKFAERMGNQITSHREMMIYSLSEAIGMEWEGTLSSKPTMRPEAADPKHWWSTVRDVPGSWLNTELGSERFIFYEATAKQLPVIQSRLDEKGLEIRNTGFGASGQVLVIVNDGLNRSFAMWENIPAGKSVRIERLALRPVDDAGLLDLCTAQWRSFGMSDAEAKAIVTTWKPDLLNRLGFIVAARMPSTDYELMFPLDVTPHPNETVRVGVVFDTLPGQDRRLDWLPGMREKLESWAKDLGSDNFKTREQAAVKFGRAGDLAKPYLKQLATSENAELSRVAGVLLKQLEPPTTMPAGEKE